MIKNKHIIIFSLFTLLITGCLYQGFSATNSKNSGMYAQDDILKNYPNNYIDKIIGYSAGKIQRWHHTSFPLRVYIEPAQGLPAYYEKTVKDAFNAWQYYSNRRAGFVFVNDKSIAHIKCRFLDKVECGSDSAIGCATPLISGKQLHIVDIQLNKHLGERQLLHTSLHEIGHALGLRGHSTNKKDIMFPVSLGNVMSTQLSTGDISTFMLLYSMIPDICDKEYSQEDRNKFWTSNDILGSIENRQKLVQESINTEKEIKDNVNKAAEIIQKGLVYEKAKDYDKAISLYKEGLKFDVYNDTILFSIGNCYYNKKDYTNAISYFKKAAEVRKNYPKSNIPECKTCGDIDKAIPIDLFNCYTAQAKKYQTEQFYANAINAYKEALTTKKEISQQDSRLVFTQISDCYLKLHDSQNSIKYKKYADDISKNPEIIVNYYKNEINNAFDYKEKAKFTNILAEYYKNKKDYKNALYYAQSAYNIDRTDDNNANIAKLYLESGDMLKAKNIYLAILNRNPKHRESYIELYNIYKYYNYKNEIENLKERARRNFPTNPPIR